MPLFRPAATGAVMVMAAAGLWGTTRTAQALSPYAGSPLGLGGARVLVAGLVIAVVAAVASGRAAWRVPAGCWRFLAVGAVCMGTYQACFFAATRLTGVAVGTLTAIGSA